MIYLFFDLLEKGEVQTKTYFILIFGIGTILLAFYSVWKYFKNSPIITIDKNYISFNEENYRIDDIKNIILTGKMPFKYLITFPMEGAFIEFKNGTEKYIFNDMYSNAWQIKSLLEIKFLKKQDFSIPKKTKIDASQIKLEITKEYKGQQFTSFRGISLWGMIIFSLLIIFSKNRTLTLKFWMFSTIFSFFWFLFNSLLMNFFALSKKLLIIKNHNLIWKLHVYNLKDIKEVVFEAQGKMPNSLRIITKDYRNKLYPAATLRDKTWLLFKNHLEKNDIKVRDECIYY